MKQQVALRIPGSTKLASVFDVDATAEDLASATILLRAGGHQCSACSISV